MLIGSFAHMLDAKGRVFIPAKWRETLGETVVLTIGVLHTQAARCLYGMSVPQWRIFSDRLAALPVTDVAGQGIRRRLYRMAAACELDRQGRILIPLPLREAAGLSKDVTLVGINDRIEVWNPATLSEYSTETDEAYEAALTHLAQLGI